MKIPETVNNAGGFAGFTDWRIPTKEELQKLIAMKNDYRNQVNIPGDCWSSTPISTADEYAWFLSDYDRNIRFSLKSSDCHVLLVRSLK